MAANRLIAFATCLTHPAITKDDAPLAEELARSGYQVEAAPWDDPAIDWARYTAIVIRSAWNYYTQKALFRTWLDLLQSNRLPVFNPAGVLEWNMDKQYLSTLREQDIPIPECYFLAQGRRVDLADFFETTRWEKAVIKPCISATAYNTRIATPAAHAADAEWLNGLLMEDSFIIQEFIEEILSDGEYSLIFIEEEYSHAVKKTSRPGDFRVQEQFGGVSTPVEPEPFIIRQARHVLDKAFATLSSLPASPQAPAKGSNDRLLYARVDGVLRKGTFTLMELELIEPVLFFQDNRTAIRKFARALIGRITVAAGSPANLILS